MTLSRETGSRTVAALDQVWKFYGSFAALQGVDFELRTGEVHILLGENGAGKSTLVGILTGTHLPDKGSMTINGEAIPKYSPRRARLEGVNAVMQDFEPRAVFDRRGELFSRAGGDDVRPAFEGRNATAGRLRDRPPRSDDRCKRECRRTRSPRAAGAGDRPCTRRAARSPHPG